MADKKKEEPKKETPKVEPTKEEPKIEPKSSDDKLVELEKKVGELGKYIGESSEFLNGASVVIQTLAGNPNLVKSFQEELRTKYGVVSQGQGAGIQPQQGSQAAASTTPPTDEIKRTVEDVAGSQRDQIVRTFEDRYFVGMKDEERTDARRKVESHFNRWGWQVKNAPLSTLASKLESAFVSTHAEKLREEGKLEGITKAAGLAQATMPSISGGAPQTAGGEETLTPAQKKWAEKLGVKEESAAKRYFTQDEEKTRQKEVKTE